MTNILGYQQLQKGEYRLEGERVNKLSGDKKDLEPWKLCVAKEGEDPTGTQKNSQQSGNGALRYV